MVIKKCIKKLLQLIRKLKRKIFRRKADQARIEEICNRIDSIEQKLEIYEYYSSCRYGMNNNTDKKLVKVHFINMFGKENVGDYNCGPYQYFSSYFSECQCYVHKLYNVNFADIQKDDYVIIGGGGLIDHCDEWNNIIRKCNDISGHVIIWGVGKNTHFGDNCQGLDLKQFELVGIRDYFEDNDSFVPCPSCMLPQLEYDYEIVRKIGIVEHACYPIKDLDYEKINNAVDIYTILKFIGTSEVIISNSYHAIYWATLMKKKVIIYDKFSDKFDYIKWKQPMYSGDIENDLKLCKVYPKALEESRSLNINFAEKVRALLPQ